MANSYLMQYLHCSTYSKTFTALSDLESDVA